MTDHHNILQSNGAKLLEMAERIVVIDHHRRSTDMGVKPILIYIEAGASSTCEILTEMIPFISSKVDISELEATFMLAGMTIDTRKWRERTGVRTYDAASALRKLGADPQVAYDYLKDTYDEFVLKSAIMNASERYPDGIVIAAVENEKITRSIMSQVADSLLSIQDVKAAFVIAQDKSTGINSISARSNGEINVQAIMEAMHGGGHMTAAATQRKDATVKELKEELINIIEQQKKEAEDESNS
jgi:DHHA1 domain protein